MGTSEVNPRGNPAMNELDILQGGLKILPVTSCYRNRDKLRPAADEPFGSYADFTVTLVLKKDVFVSCLHPF